MSILRFLQRKKISSTNSSDGKSVESIEHVSNANIGPKGMGCAVARSTNAAFQEAWEKHWMKLSKKEQKEWSFKGPHSALEVQKTAANLDELHREKSNSRQITGPALKLLRAIETVMAGATIGVQAFPNISSIVVAVARVIINVRFCIMLCYSLAHRIAGCRQIFRIL